MNTAFRYFRPSQTVLINQEMKIRNTNCGGITAYIVFETDYAMKVAFSICREDENFDKAVGRAKAVEAMENGEFVIIPNQTVTGQHKLKLDDYVFGYFKNNVRKLTSSKQRAGVLGTVVKMMSVYVDKHETSGLSTAFNLASFLKTSIDPAKKYKNSLIGGAKQHTCCGKCNSPKEDVVAA